MKIKKKTMYIVLAAAAVIILFLAFRGGSAKYPYIDTPKPALGPDDAAVTLVEYGDIQCPACKSAHPLIKQILLEYEGKIHYQFYHFPLTSIHSFAQKAGEAVECANDQGRFFDYLDAAYISSPDLSSPVLKRIAADLGLDTESFSACLDSSAKKSFVQADYRTGVQQGVAATPTFFVNGDKVSNWPETLRPRIDRLLLVAEES